MSTRKVCGACGSSAMDATVCLYVLAHTRYLAYEMQAVRREFTETRAVDAPAEGDES